MNRDLRIKAVKRFLQKNRHSAYLVTGRENLCYLTGFGGSFGMALVAGGKLFLLVDGRYHEHAAKTACFDELVLLDDIFVCLKKIVSASRTGSLVFDAEDMTVSFHETLRKTLEPVELRPVSGGFLRQRRAVKDADEIAVMRAAAARSKKAFREFTAARFGTGVSEKSLALDLEYLLKTRSEGISFDPIVLSGRNASLPHGVPSGRKLCAGDPVIMDFGMKWKDYCTDHTRTLFNGRTWVEQYHATVMEAFRKGLERIRPGAAVKDVDIEVRKYFEGKGVLNNFLHSSGHGIGLTVHEMPGVSFRSGEILKEGMVITLEPGLYFPGKGGVRHEEMILVTKAGFEVL